MSPGYDLTTSTTSYMICIDMTPAEGTGSHKDTMDNERKRRRNGLAAFGVSDPACPGRILSFNGSWFRGLMEVLYIPGFYVASFSWISTPSAVYVYSTWGITMPAARAAAMIFCACMHAISLCTVSSRTSLTCLFEHWGVYHF
jgi:hypothetical protein